MQSGAAAEGRHARRTGPQALFAGGLAQKRSFFDKLTVAAADAAAMVFAVSVEKLLRRQRRAPGQHAPDAHAVHGDGGQRPKHIGDGLGVEQRVRAENAGSANTAAK